MKSDIRKYVFVFEQTYYNGRICDKYVIELNIFKYCK